MDNANSMTDKIPTSGVKSIENSQTLATACSAMRDEIKDESHQMFPDEKNIRNSQTLATACSAMRDEIKDKSHQIFSDAETIGELEKK